MAEYEYEYEKTGIAVESSIDTEVISEGCFKMRQKDDLAAVAMRIIPHPW